MATASTEPKGGQPVSEKNWKRNTAGLTAHAHSRKEHTRKGVEEAITTLLREQKPVNFTTVARAATVSKAYLYSQPDLRERIEVLRQQGVEQMVRERASRVAEKTDASRDLIILAKDRRIKALEGENRQLQRQLKTALAKAYEQI